VRGNREREDRTIEKEKDRGLCRKEEGWQGGKEKEKEKDAF
jgi:hypothetical protein